MPDPEPWPNDDDTLIRARGLVKTSGPAAVDGIDVDVGRGEAFGFLGPNGAGKSSTMRMIGASSPVTDGTLRIFGLDPATHGRQIRSRIGVVPQQDQLDGELTVEENLLIYGRYFDIPRRDCKERTADCSTSSSSANGLRAGSSRCPAA